MAHVIINTIMTPMKLNRIVGTIKNKRVACMEKVVRLKQQ